MVINNCKERLGIFFFYDKDGIADSYVSYLLQGMRESLKRLVIVCNGELSSEAYDEFEKYSSEIIVRENEGLDVGAYQEAMYHIGWENLGAYDELVIFNHTIMGPVYPFEEMFAEMNKRDVDFWGITKYGKESFDPFGYNPYGYIPEHIQSHFMVFRKNLLNSEAFQSFWKEMPVVKSYDESVGYFESAFTKKFADKGFKWDVYVDTDEYKDITTYPLIFYAKELIKNKRCPIFKRRMFFQSYKYVVANTVGQGAMELLEYLRDKNLYDVDMIWENLLRTCNQADLVKNMQLQYILPSNIAPVDKVEEEIKSKKIALVMHLYFEDLIDSSFEYAESMPASTDIYITTNTENKKRSIEKKFAESKFNRVEVRVIENRGRDVSSILVGVKDVIEDYDIACFVHDKKTAQIKPGSVGEGFAYQCFENTLHNEKFVYNVLNCFLDNPRLGLLVPPVPSHGDFFPTLGLEWSMNFENTEALARKLKIAVPMDGMKEPIAPLGTFFWFRPSAFKYLYDYDWKYEDFPKEPNNIDGTLLHAVERIYPFAVQQAGYYPAMVMVDKFAGIEVNNLEYYVREYNRVLLDNQMGGYQHQMVDRMKEAVEGKIIPKEIHDYVCEEWTKTAKDLNKTVEELTNIKNSLSWRIVSRINRFLDFILLRTKNH